MPHSNPYNISLREESMSNINWDLWLKKPTVTIGQACALSLGIDPDKMTHRDKEREDFQGRLKLLIEIIFFMGNIRVASTNSENIDSEIYLDSFAEWALNIVHWDTPNELKTLVSGTSET